MGFILGWLPITGKRMQQTAHLSAFDGALNRQLQSAMLGISEESTGERVPCMRNKKRKPASYIGRKTRRSRDYIADEESIATNRVKEAIQDIKERQNLKTIVEVARLVGQHERIIYRLQKHKVLPANLPYLHRWARLSGRPIEYLIGEWK